MNDVMRKEMGEEAVAVKLANYVLDREADPDAYTCILARQFLRKRETIRSIVAACGGRVFVPSSVIVEANDPMTDLVVSFNDEQCGYDIRLKTS